MKQVLVRLRPTDGDALSRVDRARGGAGTSGQSGSPEERVPGGRATVFVSSC